MKLFKTYDSSLNRPLINKQHKLLQTSYQQTAQTFTDLIICIFVFLVC